MKKCKHELWERESACADGACPICLSAFILEQQLIIKGWEKASDVRIRKYKLLLAENRKLRKKITSLELFDPDIPIK